jgi:hypothetical protein
VTPELHPDERALFIAQLRRRTATLAKMLQQSDSAPSAVISFSVGLILRAALPLCNDSLRDDIFTWLGARQREAAGLCPFCGAKRAQLTDLMCPRCMEEAAEEDRQILLHEADEDHPQ